MVRVFGLEGKTVVHIPERSRGDHCLVSLGKGKCCVADILGGGSDLGGGQREFTKASPRGNRAFLVQHCSNLFSRFLALVEYGGGFRDVSYSRRKRWEGMRSFWHEALQGRSFFSEGSLAMGA